MDATSKYKRLRWEDDPASGSRPSDYPSALICLYDHLGTFISLRFLSNWN